MSYPYLLRALEISDELTDYNISPNIWLNIANVYAYYQDYTNAISCYKNGVRSAIESHNWKSLLSNMANMISQAYAIHDLHGISEEIDVYCATEIQ